VESGIMPKVMVLFFGDDDSSALADAAASGAKAVRFTEVDVCAASKTSARHKPLGADHRFANYDGVVLVSTERELVSATSATLSALLDEGPNNSNNANSANVSSVLNVVIGVLASNGALLEWAARSGGILVTQPASPDAADVIAEEAGVVGAKALGTRVAKVAGWVRHALGHEAEHVAAHEAAHEAAHNAEHSHSHPPEHSHAHAPEHHHH
jgi:hypothetical protein